MRRATAAAALLVLLAAPARGQVDVGAGIEYFAWHEHTAPVAVTESGPLLALSLGVAQPSGGPARLAYHGEGRIGIADYRGSFLTAPRVAASTTTVFAAMRHEAQLRLRAPQALEAVGGLAWDWWHRQLSATQQEDYQIVSAVLALERADTGAPAWSFGAGLRLPLSQREDAHFDALGYQQNPALQPGKRAAWHASLRRRFGPRWSAAASLERFALGRSPSVTLTTRNATATAYQPATTLLVLGARIECRW